MLAHVGAGSISRQCAQIDEINDRLRRMGSYVGERPASTPLRCANLRGMRRFRHLVLALLALLLGSTSLLSTTSANACVFSPTPVKIEPTFSVRVFNDLGPVEGLKLKIVRIDSKHPVVEATTNSKGVAVFQLQRQLRGVRLFLQPDHNALGWQWPELDIETTASKSSIEIMWPSQILRTKNLAGVIRIQDLAYPPQVFPLIRAGLSLRSLVTYEEIATTVTDEKGAFQVPGIRSGLYYLQINGKNKNDSTVPRGDIAVFIGRDEAIDGLSIITRFSDCGLEYQLGKEIR